MVSGDRSQELMKSLYNAVVDMDEVAAAELSQALLDEGVDAYEAVMNGLAAAMSKAGELYAEGEYFVPELLLCSDAFYAGLNILQPHIKVDKAEKKRQVIIGVVEGDIHDIGKNFVKVMFEAAGWIVHDLGKDVKLSRFAEEQQRIKADIVAMSALMTTSMMGIPEAIKMIKAQDPEVSIIVGGAPLTREIAMYYGADEYGSTAAEAVEKVLRCLER